MAHQIAKGIPGCLSKQTIVLSRIQSQLLPGLICMNQIHGRTKIGKREVVGFGIAGTYFYHDRMDYPFPAIRFKEDVGEIAQLREKEKGDWKKLTLDEKKKLYRASFCRTYAEMGAPTGEWKSITAGVCLLIGVALWINYLMKLTVYGPYPESTSLENKTNTLDMMIKWRVGAISGAASKFDYEKDQWKE